MGCAHINVRGNAKKDNRMKTIFTFFILLPLFCISQKQGNIWYFGDHAGLDFNSGVPVALTDGATYNDSYPHSEGTAVISDSSGSVLFYTNGQKIWNKNHLVMPHGDSLLGHLSSTQAALIVPMPGSSRYFYVFTTDAFYQDFLKNGFRYSVVDICLDGGLGDIIPTQKNILLVDTVAEKLTAVRHGNGLDYWIITHKFFSDAFYAYLLTNTGIVDTVISHVGSYHKEYCTSSTLPTRSALGALKASPDGTKLACVNGQTCYHISEMFDFDKNTGIVSNVLHLLTDTVAVGLYGVSFSPDNSKLYISSWISNDRIYQYDLSSGIPATIVSSKTIIASHIGGPWYQAMQLGPDGKIYIALRNQTSLAVINNPNLSSVSCNFSDLAIPLSGRLCSLGLPNFIDFFEYSNTTNVCTVEVDELNSNKEVVISPNPFSSEAIFKSNTDFKNANLTIYNTLGQEIKNIKNISGQELKLSRGNLQTGIYFIRLTQDSKIIAIVKFTITD